MKIYLAGASREIDLCESFRDRVRASGHTITHDWMREIRLCPVTDQELSHEARHTYALDDMRGVLAADVTWVLCPENKSVGCWVELGMALAIGATVVVSGPWDKCIFSDLAPHRFIDHEQAFDWIVNESEKAA